MKDDRKELEETKKQNGSGDDENIVMGNSEIPKSLEEVIVLYQIKSKLV